MKENMTMLIMSCDKFSDLWNGHVRLLEKNWPDRNISTYIVTDIPTKKEYPNIGIISADAEWSDRLAYALKQVNTDYIFLTLDDYYLIKNVSNAAVSELVDMMQKEDIDYVRLFPRPKKATKEELPGYKKIHLIDTSKNYSVNLYSGIWKKDFLEGTIKKPMNVWQYEVSLHKRAEEYGARCVASLRNEFQILDVVRKGKLLHKAAAYFKKNPGIYDGNREVNSWEYEIKLTIQQQAARHLPGWAHKRVKEFMKKRGHQFFSDQAE